MTLQSIRICFFIQTVSRQTDPCFWWIRQDREIKWVVIQMSRWICVCSVSKSSMKEICLSWTSDTVIGINVICAYSHHHSSALLVSGMAVWSSGSIILRPNEWHNSVFTLNEASRLKNNIYFHWFLHWPVMRIPSRMPHLQHPVHCCQNKIYFVLHWYRTATYFSLILCSDYLC